VYIKLLLTSFTSWVLLIALSMLLVSVFKDACRLLLKNGQYQFQFFMFHQKTLMSDIAELPLKNLIK